MSGRPAALAVPIGAGAATALALGLYASIHNPTGRDFVVAGFDSAASWKSALASVVVLMFVTQVSLGLRITGRLGPRNRPPKWAPELHRLIGTIAFGLSLPVVFHCIWSLGYQAGVGRVGVHSILGCIAYGMYVTKVLAVRVDDRPQWALPVAGSLLGVVMLSAWWTSALVHYAGTGA